MVKETEIKNIIDSIYSSGHCSDDPADFTAGSIDMDENCDDDDDDSEYEDDEEDINTKEDACACDIDRNIRDLITKRFDEVDCDTDTEYLYEKVLRTWQESKDKESVEKTFECFTNLPFDIFLASCVQKINGMNEGVVKIFKQSNMSVKGFFEKHMKNKSQKEKVSFLNSIYENPTVDISDLSEYKLGADGRIYPAKIKNMGVIGYKTAFYVYPKDLEIRQSGECDSNLYILKDKSNNVMDELYYVYNETKTHTYLAQIKYGTGSDSLYVVVDADSDIDMEKEILSRYMQGQFDIDGNGDSMVDVDIMSGDSEFREMVITELYK